MNAKSLANLKPPIQKGEVRNPHGINRKRQWTDRMFQRGETLLKLSKAGEKKRKELDLPETATWADAATEELMRKAANGDTAAIKEMADRTEGKPPERIEIAGVQRQEININVNFDRTKR